MKIGKVYIIGAGPGDYRLLTLKAVEAIKKSDVIVFDRLVDSKVLSFASDNAEFVYVGKQPELHQVPQKEINKILIKYANEGKTVSRVKGGDPFLFGRGGEECEFLQKHGVQYEVVPGVTSAIAVPAYCGIPVTHRDYSSSLHIITGHNSADKDDSICDYETLAKLEGTLVFLMGVKNIDQICFGLLKYGKNADTPVAIIENGTSPKQRILTGTLENIVEKSANAEVKSPSVIVVGDVVKLGEKLAWYGKGALSGKRIVVTRPAAQSDSLVKGLEEQGAHVIEFPVIKISEVEDYRPLHIALENIHEYSWVVFTSTNGVNMFYKQMHELKKDIRLLNGLKLAVVGSATNESLQKKGLYADFIPEKFSTADLLEGLIKLVGQEEKILIINSEIASHELSDGLKANGISFDDISVYTIKENVLEAADLIYQLDSNNIDFVTFTSPSSVKAFASIIGSEKIRKLSARLVCIGPVTAKAAIEIGIEVTGTAEEYIVDGIIKKLIELSER
jgi:uroporphyrinogen III methyltransferase / synthase